MNKAEAEIEKAVSVMKKGGTILYPTDTIWGLGCDATSKKAVNHLHRIKRRSDRKSYIILLDDPSKLKDFVQSVPLVAEELLQSIDTPLTIVYPGAKGLAKNVISEDGTVGIRIPQNEFVRDLIRSFGKPIVSTSANFSGDPPPKSFRDISEGLKEEVDYTLDVYQDRIDETKPSTIIRIREDGDYELLRK